ncbi:16S rRNA (uracil(1498)-N(3))-methyltransferase [Candidatus Endowatersipora endosymbiont of Watersipora subatra]|uniref:16S rRNA (uracil(1498)-N(3))-methyltransferase n=1 Tax=Candidatus Endowatersipora endosymbiont of Watersipora subatra TaxID=3077946 RepID=UPI00312CC0D5
MPRLNLKKPRLFVEDDLHRDKNIELNRNQTHYLLNVLRRKVSDDIFVFNGRDGEWSAYIESEQYNQRILLRLLQQIRSQLVLSDLTLFFAPLKEARLQYLIQKSVEMGTGILQPILTEYTKVRKINRNKIQRYAIEAAEQCGLLTIPMVDNLIKLTDALSGRRFESTLIFCDETLNNKNPIPLLKHVISGPIDLLIGPEGGFSKVERELIRSQHHTIAISLGPRILRADTASVAALAIIQATIGDWSDPQ